MMMLDTSDFLQREIYLFGDYEPEIRTKILEGLKPGDTFVDIGANVGFYSLCASRVVGSKGKIYAFEPAPSTYAALKNNIDLNGVTNIITASVALSDTQGQAKLFLDAKHNSGATSLRRSPNSGPAIDVVLTTYDQFAKENELPVPSLVKVDVEGAEVKVLRGMNDLLGRPNHPHVILEVSEWSLREMGSSKEELFDIMDNHGYRAILLSAPKLSIFSKKNIFFQYDVLFSPN